jgi:4-amino-4-deoxychorismate lyase
MENGSKSNSLMDEFETKLWQKDSSQGWIEQPPFLLNRGLLFGDGLFETMIFSEGQIRFASLHSERLFTGCSILGLNAKMLTEVYQLENELITKFGTELDLRIRWIVYREGQGKYSPLTDDVVELVNIQGFLPSPKIKKQAYISSKISVPASPWSHCKTLNALIYVMANKERIENGMDEVILLTPEGYISESGSSNIFWMRDGKYFTPSLSCNCIAGIARKTIINRLIQYGKSISEGEFFQEALLSADQVFVCNVAGVSLIESIGDRQFDLNLEGFLMDIF